MTYKVIPTNELYRGRTYSSWVSDWLNWFLSTDADERNFGPVVFLRSHGLPNPCGCCDGTNGTNGNNGLTVAKDVATTYADDTYYPRPYSNNPNVRVGGERLRINESQAVLIPIIVAFEVARKPYFDWGIMQEFTGLTIDYGDNPPDSNQLTIDGNPIKPPLQMEDFRIVTPIVTAVVPESDYGRSVKDFLEEDFPVGHYPAIVEGYFVLIKFKPGEYLIHSWASAPRETRGPYFSELIYQIEVDAVRPRAVPSKGVIPFRPGRNEAIIRKILSQKVKIGELPAAISTDIARKIRI
jgi:hypothetical protein